MVFHIVRSFVVLGSGIGFGQMIVNCLVIIYYNVIIAWSLFYLFTSLVNMSHLPWTDCFNDWNTFC